MTSQERAFHEFASFAATLKGDEKSEAQTFLQPITAPGLPPFIPNPADFITADAVTV